MDLGLLFKSSFKAFVKSKWIILLLGLIVFATVGTFTVLFSVSNSTQRSFDGYMTQGKVHDFTVDERYSIAADPAFTAQPVEGTDPRQYKLVYAPAGNPDVNFVYRQLVPDGRIVTADEQSGVKSADDAFAYFRNLIVKRYSEQRQQTFMDDVTKAPSNVGTVAISQSMLVFSDVKSYKFVWSQGSFTSNTEQRVDQVVLSSGENITVQAARLALGSGQPIDCNSSRLVSAADPWNELPSLTQAWKSCIYNAGKIGDTVFKNVADYASEKMGNGLPRYLPNNLDKGYEIVVKDQSEGSITGGKPIAIRNPTSYEAIVSPAFAAANHIVPVTHEQLYGAGKGSAEDIDGSKHFDTATRTIDNWQGLEQGTISVGGTRFVVVGVGTSPDYAYPIMDLKNPGVNANNQAVLFVNKPGIERVYDVFAGSDVENYLVGRFLPGVPASVDHVNTVAKDYMTFKEDSLPAQLRDSAGTNLASLRIGTLQQLASSIVKVTIVVIIVMCALSGFILVVVIKRQIRANRTTLGILEANGFPKAAIAFSFSTIAGIIGFIPPLLGFIVGYFLQSSFFGAFASFWTLPAPSTDFSVPLMVLIILAVAIGAGIIAFLVALWTLRGRIIDNINDVNTASSFGKSLSRVFGWLDIKSRYALAIFTNNLLKMVVIAGAITASVAAGSIAISSIGKLEQAKTDTAAIRKYAYKIDLATPSEQGGQYGTFNFNEDSSNAVPTKAALSAIANPQNGQIAFVADEVTDPNGIYAFVPEKNYWQRMGAEYVPLSNYYSTGHWADLATLGAVPDNSVVKVVGESGADASRNGFYLYSASSSRWVQQDSSYSVSQPSPLLLNDPKRLFAITGALTDGEITVAGAPVNLINGYYRYDAASQAWTQVPTWDSLLRPLQQGLTTGSSIDWSSSESWVTSPYPSFQNGSKGGFGGSVAVAACGNEVYNFCTESNLNDPAAPLNLTNWYGQNHQIQYKGVLSQLQEGQASNFKIPPAWQLAESLLPENQRNSFNQNYLTIANGFESKINEEVQSYVASGSRTQAEIAAKIAEERRFYDPSNFTAPYLAAQMGTVAFVVAYNQIGFDPKTDILYSHADGYIGSYATMLQASAQPRLSITGLKTDDPSLGNFYQLPSDFNSATASYAASARARGFSATDQVPVFLNRFMVDKYGFGVGDTITFTINNTVDIDRKTLLAPNGKYHETVLKVVGVIDTYQGNEILTSQDNVNILLQQGLVPDSSRLVSFNATPNDGKTSPTNFFNNVGFLFNGILSSAKLPLALSTLSIYSRSGFYPAAATLQTGEWNGKGKKQFYVYPEIYYSSSSLPANAKDKDQGYVENRDPSDAANGLYEYSASEGKWAKASAESSMSQTPYGTLLAKSGITTPLIYERVYGLNPYSAITTSNIDVAALSSLVFNQVSSFVNVILWTILIITVLISVIFTIIMAISIIEDNKRNIATLKVLGYKDGEIASIFTRGYVTPMLVGVGAAIPLAILFTYLIRQFLVNLGGISAPIDIVGWEVAISAVVVLACFAWLFFQTLRSMRSQSALLALH